MLCVPTFRSVWPEFFSYLLDNDICCKMGTSTSKRDLTDEEAAIDRVVQRLLSNPSVNQAYVPDSLERKVYERLLTQVIGTLKETLESTKIEILDHVITLHMAPLVAPPRLTTPLQATLSAPLPIKKRSFWSR